MVQFHKIKARGRSCWSQIPPQSTVLRPAVLRSLWWLWQCRLGPGKWSCSLWDWMGWWDLVLGDEPFSNAATRSHPRRDLWAVCWFVCFLCCGRSVNFESWFCPTIGLSFWDCQGENPCLIVILIGAMAKSLGWYCSWTMHPPFKCVYRLPIQLVPDSQHFSKKNIATGFSCCPDHRRDVLLVLDCSG